MVDKNRNLDIPLGDEIDLQRSKSAKTKRVLMILVLIAAISISAAAIWRGKGKLPKKAMFSNLPAGKKTRFPRQFGGLIKKRPIYKIHAQVSNLDILKVGKAFYKKGELNKAEAKFTEGMKIKDHQEVVINNLGVVLFSKGKLIESVAMFKKALETNPFFPDAHFNLAYVSEKMGNKNRSFYHYKRFLEFSRESHTPLVRKLKKRMGVLN